MCAVKGERKQTRAYIYKALVAFLPLEVVVRGRERIKRGD
jgi:hypothetical protein